MVVRKMLEVEREEIVFLRLYEKRKIKMIRQMRLMVIVIVCNLLNRRDFVKWGGKEGELRDKFDMPSMRLKISLMQ